MTKFLLRRVFFGVLTLFLVSVIVFAGTQALPGDAAQAILGKSATAERLAALRHQLHLGQSVFAQFGHWIGGIVTGDLGTSAATQQPVSKLLSGRLANSAFLVLLAAVIAIPLSIGLGSWMAMRRDHLVDHVGSTISLVLAALPEFVIAFPGIGAALVDAVGNRDVPTVQALSLIIAAVYVVLNLAADVTTILVTPRLRTSGR